jgi:hypothetical protein
MSAPDPMPCIADTCLSPLSCSHTGQCRERARTSAREYDEGLKACRERGVVDPFKSGEPG